MKDQSLVSILSVIIAFLICLLAVLEIKHCVNNALEPVMAQVQEIKYTQHEIEQRLAEENQSNLQAQLAVVNAKISALENRPTTALPSVGGNNNAPQPSPQYQQPDMNKVYDIPIGTTPVLGNLRAPVTITAFLDFQCPFCNRFYPALKEVLAAYPDKVKIVVKNFPLSFHPNALPAAKLALAANEQGKYYQIIDLLMQNAGDTSDDKIKDYAKQLHLNYGRLMKDYKDKDAEWQKIIDADTALGNQSDVRGTPTFYINGKQTMARDLPSYKTEIDKILSGNK